MAACAGSDDGGIDDDWPGFDVTYLRQVDEVDAVLGLDGVVGSGEDPDWVDCRSTPSDCPTRATGNVDIVVLGCGRGRRPANLGPANFARTAELARKIVATATDSAGSSSGRPAVGVGRGKLTNRPRARDRPTEPAHPELPMYGGRQDLDGISREIQRAFYDADFPELQPGRDGGGGGGGQAGLGHGRKKKYR